MSEIKILKTSDDFIIKAFSKDFITRQIEKHGVYEKYVLDFVKQILLNKRDPLVLDVGANIGNHTLSFCSAGARVHAFEPVKPIHDILKYNIEKNGLSERASVYNFALSDCFSKEKITYESKGNVGGSSLENRVEGNLLDVKLEKGDDFVIKQDFKKIDLIKIDVEGHEYKVLQGLIDSIKKFKPIIVIEWNEIDTIERILNTSAFCYLEENYIFYVLGSNYDREFYKNKFLGGLRCKIQRELFPRKALLYPFKNGVVYENLILVSKEDKYMLSFVEQYLK
ncbi:methyltransferase FkbM [Hydrogenovibrio crunogenus]|uniref:Methyltransferase FkbM n=1 Tax=Hydrogenovibrio crunogenus TaxID=39765 RepID=A0A4P7P0Q1_9GAMM|nr:FkbM family methyltransferase [Hydrogenovibrio crunogenus]QBZ83546.1 methyltransferase FkbM [Hydrogenovibrio crunogenus]